MKTSTALVTTLLALGSFPLLAQQTSPATQTPPAATQQNAPASTSAATAAAPATPMSPVNGELVSKLDSKTAKTGDDVVVQTKASVKTADGTEIPKGSKLMGHVIAVQPSGAGVNSQVVLQFDHIELKGGQSVAVHSQIQSISPPIGAASTSGADATAMGGSAMTAMTAPPAGGTASPAGANATNGGNRAGAVQQGTTAGDPGAVAPAGSGSPVAGTVVARNGQIAIQTTAIPGILLANNAPGQQDPRMARASSILLGAKKDIQLDGGTQMVVGLSAAVTP